LRHWSGSGRFPEVEEGDDNEYDGPIRQNAKAKLNSNRKTASKNFGKEAFDYQVSI
jgi:hypothetical protein